MKQPNTPPKEILSRRDYQEILLARMAGGDLYANELRLKIRRVDIMFDKLRVVCGEKPLYSVNKSHSLVVEHSNPNK